MQYFTAMNGIRDLCSNHRLRQGGENAPEQEGLVTEGAGAGADRVPTGGIAGGIGIKVGNMVPACCECNPGGSIADVLSRSASRFEVGPRLGPSAAVRNPRPAAGGE